MTTLEKVNAGHYSSKLQFPTPDNAPNELRLAKDKAEQMLEQANTALREWRSKQKNKYQDDECRLTKQFRDDLEKEHGMKDSPKAEFLYGESMERWPRQRT